MYSFALYYILPHTVCISLLPYLRWVAWHRPRRRRLQWVKLWKDVWSLGRARFDPFLGKFQRIVQGVFLGVRRGIGSGSFSNRRDADVSLADFSPRYLTSTPTPNPLPAAATTTEDKATRTVIIPTASLSRRLQSLGWQAAEPVWRELASKSFFCFPMKMIIHPQMAIRIAVRGIIDQKACINSLLIDRLSLGHDKQGKKGGEGGGHSSSNSNNIPRSSPTFGAGRSRCIPSCKAGQGERWTPYGQREGWSSDLPTPSSRTSHSSCSASRLQQTTTARIM